MWLLAAGLVYASYCPSDPPPVVMGGVRDVTVPPAPRLRIDGFAGSSWPPLLVLVDATEEKLPTLAGHATVPLSVTELPMGAGAARSPDARSAEVTPTRALPPGSSWRVYWDSWTDGWVSIAAIHVADGVPMPAWTSPPRVRTGRRAPGYSRILLAALYGGDGTALFVPPDTTDAAFLAVWEGRVGAPVDYDRPPDDVASRGRYGFHLASASVCEPRGLVVPLTGGDDRVYGIRPVDTQGRTGPAVEVTLVEARANEREEGAGRARAAVAACDDARGWAVRAWQNTAHTAARELRAALPACEAWVDAEDVPDDAQACAGAPTFERARLVERAVSRLRAARTPAEVQAVVRDASGVDGLRGGLGWAAAEACAEVPEWAVGWTFGARTPDASAP